MALGCAFIFVVILMCWRRRARKQREKQTKMFASAKKLDNPHGWRWRLAKFGERLFGRKKARPDAELPVAYNHHHYHHNSRPQSIVSEREYGQDIKMKKMPSSKDLSRRETVDDFIDAYNYSTHRTSRAPSTLPELDHGYDREYTPSERQDYTKRLKKQLHPQQRRIEQEQESLYSEVTGKQRLTPEPRQPLKRELSTASRFTRSSVGSSAFAPMPSRNLNATTREGLLVDLDDQSERRTPAAPLQMLSTGNTTPPRTEAQAYMMSVRPNVTGQSALPTYQPPQQQQIGPIPTFAVSPAMFGNAQVTGNSFMPIPVTLTPNTTGGQGSYWLTPVAQAQTSQPQPQPQMPPSVDTVVLQPMHTGTSSSRNPFRQGSY